jgi:hypothetical protein
MARPKNPVNPYAHRTPKPNVVSLIRLLTTPQKRNYRYLVRSLKRLPGVHGELNYYGKEWGWALRYRRGDAMLCTLHLLPRRFEATITVPKGLEDWALGPNHLSPATKRDLLSLTRQVPTKMLRLPLARPGSDGALQGPEPLRSGRGLNSRGTFPDRPRAGA